MAAGLHKEAGCDHRDHQKTAAGKKKPCTKQRTLQDPDEAVRRMLRWLDKRGRYADQEEHNGYEPSERHIREQGIRACLESLQTRCAEVGALRATARR